MKTLVSVVAGCFNEAGNVEELFARVAAVFQGLEKYDFELILIDNASTDGTQGVLRRMAAADRRVKVILNARNFGHVRSPFHGLLQARGAAVVAMASDLQDPPELIPEFLKKWEEGYQIVLGKKTQTSDSWVMSVIRHSYYRLVSRLSDIQMVENATGYGLYSQRVIEILKEIDDPYPYFRGLLCDIGFERAEVPFQQPSRKRGLTKNNFYVLYDLAMLGITNHSKVPLRLATMTGFLLAIFSLLVALGYFVYKLIFWKDFQVGAAPMVIGLFFFSAVQLFFIGILGEYIGSIHTQVLKRPRVIEKERINFD
ncbi:MAG: glycosyltransferase family 2 protein [Thermoanaerobaculia bacterium]|nr:glycosyltransferase family 2 protein [Thermoanaerobaculia bacterium]